MNESKPSTRKFELLEVLSAISGIMLNDDFSKIHELIEWTAGRPIFTHQIPSVASQIQRALTAQFPQLDVETNASLRTDLEWLIGALKDLKRRNQKEIVAHIWRKLKGEYGDSFQVAPMRSFDESQLAPLIIGKAVVIVEGSIDN